MEHSRRLHILALVAVLMAGQTVQSAEWVAEPSIMLRGEYDDNFRLTNAAHDDVWGVILDPRIALSRRSELWDLDASGRLRVAQYPDTDQFNTTDNFFNLAAKRQFERGTIDASASLINDTTLQNETLDFDTGLTVNQIDRSRLNFQIGGQYSFTETNMIMASVVHSSDDYDQGERFGLLDYDYFTPSLSLIHQYDAQTQVFGVMSHSKVDYDPTGALISLESKTNSLQLGAAYDITETWKVKGSVGSRRTSTSSQAYDLVAPPGIPEQFCSVFPICEIIVVPSDTESTGLIYDASLTREFETGDLSLTATQSITPSSTGTDSETTRVQLHATKRFSPKLSAALAVSYYQSSSVDDTTTTRADNDRYRIAPSMTWRLDEEIALTSGYNYTRVERGLASEAVDSNAFFISLGYTWPRMAVSR